MGKGIVGRWLSVLAALLLCAAPGWANYLPGGVEGCVYDTDLNNAPLVGLGVTLTTENGSNSWSTTTGSDGKYSFAGIYAGSYVVRIYPGAKYGGGYAGFASACGVSGGAVTEVNFALSHLEPSVAADVLEPTGSVGLTVRVKVRLQYNPGAYDLQHFWVWAWDEASGRSTMLVDADSTQVLMDAQTTANEDYSTVTVEGYLMWETTWSMFNGPVQLRAAARFSDPWDDTTHVKLLGAQPTSNTDGGTAGGAVTNPTIANLVVEGVSTNAPQPDYIIYDARADSPGHEPFVDFTLKDEGTTADPITGAPYQYRWTVTYQKMVSYPGYPGYGYLQPVNVTGTEDGPGAVHVPLPMDEGAAALVSAIRIAAEKVPGGTPGGGAVDMATWHLSDPCPPSDYGSSGVSDRPQVSCSYWFEDVGGGAKDVKVRYTVVDSRMPSALSFDLVTPRGEVVLSRTDLPSVLGTEQTATLGPLPEGKQEWGSYHLAVCAVDDHGDELNPWQRRDHQDRRMYALVIGQALQPFDLDMDTDNQNGLERSAAEEAMEPYASPGAWAPCTTGDRDRDGIPDFADGFDRNNSQPGTHDEDDVCGPLANFAGVVIQVPANADPSKLKVRLSYSCSDPSLITVTGEGKHRVWHLPEQGHLRLWRRRGSEPRFIAYNPYTITHLGDFIGPGDYTPAQLGLIDGACSVGLFLEAVAPSAQPADLRLDVSMDFDGDGDFGDAADGQPLTAVRAQIGIGPWGSMGSGWPNKQEPGALVRFWKAPPPNAYYDEQLAPVQVNIEPGGLAGTVRVTPTANAAKLEPRTGYYGETATTWPVAWQTGANQGYQGLWVKGVETSESVGDIGLQVDFEGLCDELRATVFDVDLIIAGVPEGQETAGTAQEPGQPVVSVNSDDDNGDVTADKEDTGQTVGENDLVSVKATTVPLLPGGVLTLAPTDPYGYYYGVGTSKLWRDPERLTPFAVPPNQYTPPSGTWDLATGPCPTLWLEGTGVSAALGDAAWRLSYAWTVGNSTVEGTADDVPLTVNPRYGKSEAWFRVFTQRDTGGQLSAERYEPVGGVIYPVLYVTIGEGERLSSTSELRVRLRDEHHLHTGDATAQVEKVLSWASGGWLKWNGAAWEEGAPAGVSNQNGTAPLHFALPMTWVTPSEPLGHNGWHSLRTAEPASFERYVVGDEWAPVTADSPKPVGVDVQNVVLRDVGTNRTPDYFVYNPDSDDPAQRTPTIRFSIADSDVHEYVWYIYMIPTPQVRWDPANFYQVTDAAWLRGTATAAGEISVTWNGRRDNNAGDLIEASSPYTFDIIVWEVLDAEAFTEDWNQVLDWSAFKFPYRTLIPDSYVDEEQVTRPGHEFAISRDYQSPLDPVADPLKATFSFLLTDQLAVQPKSMWVDLLETRYNLLASSGMPTQLGLPHLDQFVAKFASGELANHGMFNALACGIDGHAARCRDHLPRRMLSTNQAETAPLGHLIGAEGENTAHQVLMNHLDAIKTRYGIPMDAEAMALMGPKETGAVLEMGTVAHGPDTLILFGKRLNQSGAEIHAMLFTDNKALRRGSGYSVPEHSNMWSTQIGNWRRYLAEALQKARAAGKITPAVQMGALEAFDLGDGVRRAITNSYGNSTHLTGSLPPEGAQPALNAADDIDFIDTNELEGVTDPKARREALEKALKEAKSKAQKELKEGPPVPVSEAVLDGTPWTPTMVEGLRKEYKSKVVPKMQERLGERAWSLVGKVVVVYMFYDFIRTCYQAWKSGNGANGFAEVAQAGTKWAIDTVTGRDFLQAALDMAELAEEWAAERIFAWAEGTLLIQQWNMWIEADN